MHITFPERGFEEVRRALQPVADAIAEEIDVVKQLTIIEEVHTTLIAAEKRALVPRDDSTTTTSSSGSTCTGSAKQCNELPADSSSLALPIGLAISIPAVGAAIIFIYLHRRTVKRQREEDARDPHKDLDFGLNNVQGKPGNGGLGADLDKEKGGRHKGQLSLEMGIESPYLLPPELQNSRESLHSLSRTIHQNEDPYRPVTQYYPNDGASVRSFPHGRNDTSSVYTASSGAPSRFQDGGHANLLSNAAGMPRSAPPSAGEFVAPPRQASLASGPPPYDASGRPSFAESEKTDTKSPIDSKQNLFPQSQAIQRKGLPNSPAPANNGGLAPVAMNTDRDSYAGSDTAALRNSNNYLGSFINANDPGPPPTGPVPREPTPEILKMPAAPPADLSPPAPASHLPASPRPARKESLPLAPLVAPTATHPPSRALMDNEDDFGNNFEITPPSPQQKPSDLARESRYSMDVPPEEFAQAGLGAPGFDARRLSMGFRPLPPDAAIESDDPEVRANRIRSFYKEYFDDSKAPPAGQYYEDYDSNFLADAAYYDPQSNNFVMPYAQPVTRRAMTPPPRGAPRPGIPRPRNGSMGGASLGPRGRPMGPGMMSPGPRSYSSASQRMGPSGPKKPLPPPMDLSTLPTPSKLKDDTFAIMGAIDFAPPTSYRDRQAGRSESPLGERRPYSPMVPAHTPLNSAFDELPAIPSPHLLRKSGTFTSLDFAPPRKFKDSDTMSDAGSIRSNRSGVSAVQLGAIRGGAYRVSRLPQDMVGTKDDLVASLKPQWGMRPHDGL